MTANADPKLNAIMLEAHLENPGFIRRYREIREIIHRESTKSLGARIPPVIIRI